MTKFLEQAVDNKIIEKLGIFNGVWIGQIKSRNFISELTRVQKFWPESGRCWINFLDINYNYDYIDQPSTSCLALFEDKKPLGPAHSNHQEIREIGEGRFSHWNELLYFSTSDNSDPNTNGRIYEIVINLSFPLKKFSHDLGCCYIFYLPSIYKSFEKKYSINQITSLMLFEDEKVLGPADSLHQEIREIGEGRFSYWNEWLYFSTSDNSDPNINRRTYRLILDNNFSLFL